MTTLSSSRPKWAPAHAVVLLAVAATLICAQTAQQGEPDDRASFVRAGVEAAWSSLPPVDAKLQMAVFFNTARYTSPPTAELPDRELWYLGFRSDGNRWRIEDKRVWPEPEWGVATTVWDGASRRSTPPSDTSGVMNADYRGAGRVVPAVLGRPDSSEVADWTSRLRGATDLRHLGERDLAGRTAVRLASAAERATWDVLPALGYRIARWTEEVIPPAGAPLATTPPMGRTRLTYVVDDWREVAGGSWLPASCRLISEVEDGDGAKWDWQYLRWCRLAEIGDADPANWWVTDMWPVGTLFYDRAVAMPRAGVVGGTPDSSLNALSQEPTPALLSTDPQPSLAQIAVQ